MMRSILLSLSIVILFGIEIFTSIFPQRISLDLTTLTFLSCKGKIKHELDLKVQNNTVITTATKNQSSQ